MTRFAYAIATIVAGLLAGCSGTPGSGSSAGLTTASILGDAPASQSSSETLGIKNDDPRARPVQVAWTSARAQKCGYNFDPARLKSTYLAYEASQGAASVPEIEKTYDKTLTTIKASIGNADEYCTDKKGREIKADLTRHLAGDYRPNLPQPKQEVAACGGLFALACDSGEKKNFAAKDFWQDQVDKKNGTRSGSSQ